MTRYVMVADLRRCVGCQTCTAACKLTNNTMPGIQWRAVIDIESGQFPDVRRTFVPVGCQHCSKPDCMYVCPTTATRQRADGIVTIDYELCIGCGYCIVACPYQARFKVSKTTYAYGAASLANGLFGTDRARIGVATKCTFCIDRVDASEGSGLTPGIDPEVTPVCVTSCIARALHFGDLEDPESNVSRLLQDNEHFRMHEELGAEPGFYYLWEVRQ